MEGRIKLTEDFFNKASKEIRQTYFPHENHGRTENKHYHRVTQLLENFNNGCLGYDSLIGGLTNSCQEKNPELIHKILRKYIKGIS